MPESVYKTWGKQYIEDLKQMIEQLYGPAERDEVLPDVSMYDPKVIVYNDYDSGHTYVEQGQAILDAAKKHRVRGGYGLVMIHDASDRKVRQEDQLAAMLSQQFWEQHDIAHYRKPYEDWERMLQPSEWPIWGVRREPEKAGQAQWLSAQCGAKQDPFE